MTLTDREVWKPIDEFPKYAVSDQGRVMTISSELIKTPTANQQGIASVNLQKDRIQHRRSVAILVLTHFAGVHPNANFDTPINKDGDRFNNHIDNLAWRPRWFAVKYHQQFKSPWVYPAPVFIKHLGSGEQFTYWHDACTRYGLLERVLMVSTLNGTPCPPTYDRFELLES